MRSMIRCSEAISDSVTRSSSLLLLTRRLRPKRSASSRPASRAVSLAKLSKLSLEVFVIRFRIYQNMERSEVAIGHERIARPCKDGTKAIAALLRRARVHHVGGAAGFVQCGCDVDGRLSCNQDPAEPPVASTCCTVRADSTPVIATEDAHLS